MTLGTNGTCTSFCGICGHHEQQKTNSDNSWKHCQTPLLHTLLDTRQVLPRTSSFSLFSEKWNNIITGVSLLSQVWSWGPNLTLESWPSLGTRANVTWRSDRSKTCDKDSLLADKVKICEDPMIIVGHSPYRYITHQTVAVESVNKLLTIELMDSELCQHSFDLFAPLKTTIGPFPVEMKKQRIPIHFPSLP